MNWIKQCKFVLKYFIVIWIIGVFIFSGILNNTTYLKNVDNDSLINVTLNDKYEDNIITSISDIPLGWTYESKLTLDPVTPEPDYQVKIILNPYSFDYSKAKPDGSDLRFYDPLNTPLSYWIENWNPAGKSIVWVKVPIVGTPTIHMYYGNPAAVSESNGDDTFLFFDDFPGSSLNSSKWNSETDAYSTIILSNGIMNLTCTVATYHNYGVWAGFSDTIINHGVGFGTTSNNLAWFGNNASGTYTAGSNTTTYNVVPFETWFTGEIRWINYPLIEFANDTDTVIHTTDIPSTSLPIKLVARAVDFPAGNHYGAMVTTINTWGKPGQAMRLHSWNRYPSDDFNRLQCDWLLVRKCVTQEPVVIVDNIHESLIWVDPATPEADYQIKVNLNPNNFDYSLANLDGSDLRFYDKYTNPLSYWIETWNPIGKSTIWVKIPSPGTTSFYMYYGNSSAPSESDGDATFIFFDDFEGSAVNTSKWTTDNGVYSTSTVSGGILKVTTDNPDERNGGACIGFNDFYFINPGADTYNSRLNNSVNLGELGRAHRIQTRAGAASLIDDNVIMLYSWNTQDIRWISDSLVQYQNGSAIITHINSTCIPDIPLQVRILTHSTWYGLGYGCSGAVRSINAVGEAGRALRARTYFDCAYDGLAPPSIQVDWVFVRKCVEQEPAVTVVNQTINLISPKDKIYPAPMSGYYPASYGFENDVGVPYSDMTLSGHPPSGWNVYYPGQYGKLRVLEEFHGHKNVVELRKSRGTYGKDRVGMTKNFASSATVGTVEFWFHKDSDSGLDATKFRLLGSGGNIEFGIEDKALYRGPYTTKTTIATNVFPKDTWIHIRVDFDIAQGGWQIQLNNTWYGSGYAFPFESSPTDIYSFDLRSHGTEFQTGNPLHDFYLDALGYSWDPGYNIGDNLREGLLIDFEPPTKSRTDWTGYYPASEGFEDVSLGAEPDNWGFWQGGSIQPTSVDIQVLDSKTDAAGNFHSKVLYLKDNAAGPILVANGFFNEFVTSGTYEFWVLHEAPGTNWRVSWGLLKADTPYHYTVHVADEYNEFEYFDGNTSIDTGITFLENKWYRLSIDFSDDGSYAGLAPHHYRVRLYDSDGSTLVYESPDAEFQYYGSSSGIQVSTGDSVQSNLYFDAIGYSWDPNYNIGDNRFEAVNEESEPTDLSWVSYSLDNSIYLPIEGKTTIALPAIGNHTIQLYMIDSLGVPYRSELISFQVPIELLSPEDKTYHAPMGGYYPASWGFENNVPGIEPSDWYLRPPGGSTFYRVNEEYDGHKNVLEMRKIGGTTQAMIAKNFSSIVTAGTVEFWLQKDTEELYDATRFLLFNSTGYPLLIFLIDNTHLYRNSWASRVLLATGVVTKNTWHHFRIDFDVSQGGWQLQFNDVWYGSGYTLPFDNPEANHVSQFQMASLHSGDYSNYGAYLDALGYSWDSNYDVGDNLNEGLLISFNVPTTLDWAGYSLDGGTTTTILGNATIPLPPDGSHTIQVFGNDSLGNWYSSEPRSFLCSISVPSITGPNDFSIFHGDTGYSILWSVTDLFPANYSVYRNGTIYDTGSWTDSVFVWLDGLEQGIHNFTCIVENVYGKTSSDEVWIRVLPSTPDTTPPSISSPEDISFEEGSIGYSIIWKGSDDRSPWWASVRKNTTLIYDKAWIGNDIEISLDSVIKGLYIYNCTLFDEAGNSVYDIVWVNVTEAGLDIDPPVIVPPASIEFEEGTVGHILYWICFDNHPYAYTIRINDTDEIFNPWHGENVTYSVDHLPVGTWDVNLTLYDLARNSASSSVIVTVNPEAPDVTPPTVSQPAKLIIAENTAGTIIWEVDDKYPNRYTITRNGTLVYEQNYWISGIIQYHYTSLPPGTWVFTLTVWDVAGHSTAGMAIVEVLPTGEADTLPPTISQIQDVVFTHGTTNNYIIAYLFDVHPQSYSISIDTDTIIVEHTWTSPNIKVEFCLDGLMIGSYDITISAWDTYGNTASRSVSVTVQGDIDPPVIVHLPDITVEENINVTLTWQVSDETPSHYELITLPEGDIDQSGSWSSPSIEIVIVTPPPGTHHYRLIVYDLSGNYAIDDFTLTVVEPGRAPGFELITTAIFLLFFTKFKSYFSLRRRKRK
ncbi:MAG: DUF2341 domain-containing protein [Candidatus Hodarchaeota archaeon]